MKALRGIRDYAAFLAAEFTGSAPGSWAGKLIAGAWLIVLVDRSLGSVTAIGFLGAVTIGSLLAGFVAWRRER